MPRGGVFSKSTSCGAAGARTTLPSVGGPAESSPGLCIWGGSGGCCRLRSRQAGRRPAARAVAISPFAAWLLRATPEPRRRPGLPFGVALAGTRGCASPHVNAVRRILASRAGSSRRATRAPAAHRGSKFAGARAPAPLCPPVEVSRGPRRGSEGSRHGWCGRPSVSCSTAQRSARVLRPPLRSTSRPAGWLQGSGNKTFVYPEYTCGHTPPGCGRPRGGPPTLAVAYSGRRAG